MPDVLQPIDSAFTCVLDIKASLGECPVWSVREQALWWVDINAPALNRFDPATGANVVFDMPESIGCFAFRAGERGFVLALRNGLWLADTDAKPKRRIAEAPYDPAHHRFNDGRCDRAGRFFAGSMNENRDAPTGALYRLDPNLTLTRVLDGIVISNGLGFSPDGRTMYHADTPARTVSAYAYDAATGTPSQRRVFAQFDGEDERPDGCTVDSEGCYWVAFYRGGRVVRLSPRGERLAEFPLPALCPTMCAFGGPDLRTLYVTSARQQRPDDELARLPLSGGIFAMRVDVPGLPEPAFAG